MFGIDSTEFLLIAIVALVVIGPKDLPRVMRLVGGWVGRGRAMTRHLRAGFDTMMREAELEEMQKQWAKQNAEIMAATATATVPPASYDAPAGVDAVVGPHVYDHPGALPVAETVATPALPSHSGDDPTAPRPAAMTGPQPAASTLAAADDTVAHIPALAAAPAPQP